MDVIIGGKSVKRIEEGDIVVIDWGSGHDTYIAVRHSKLDGGRLTLVGLGGIGTQGTVREKGSTQSLDDYLIENNRKYEVYSKKDYVLTLTGR